MTSWRSTRGGGHRPTGRTHATDLTWVIFAGGTVGDARGAAVQVFEDDLLSLDDQLTDAADKPGLDAGGLAEGRVVGVPPHVQLLVQIQTLELALRRGTDHFTLQLTGFIQMEVRLNSHQHL